MKSCVLGCVVLMSGCVRQSEAASLPVGAQRAAQVAPTGHEGTISGRVTWRGVHPAMAAIPTTGNTQGCGAESPFEALSIGADEGVANAVITIDGLHGAVTPSTVTIDQRACNFAPHVAIVPVGGRMNFTNHDTVLHSVHAFRGDVSDFNLATPPGLSLARAITTPGILRLQCDVGHTWMSGWIHVVDTPFVAMTDAHGAYRIPNVPPGTYHVTMWHEGWTSSPSPDGRPVYRSAVTHTETVTVRANGNVERGFTLP